MFYCHIKVDLENDHYENEADQSYYFRFADMVNEIHLFRPVWIQNINTAVFKIWTMACVHHVPIQNTSALFRNRRWRCRKTNHVNPFCQVVSSNEQLLTMGCAKAKQGRQLRHVSRCFVVKRVCVHRVFRKENTIGLKPK